MKADKDYKKATEDTDITKLSTLSDVLKWVKFWELFTTYLGRVKGAAFTSLTNLIRKHGEVTLEIMSVDSKLNKSI
jgi:hypothetical protein